MQIKSSKDTYLLQRLKQLFPESSNNTLRGWIDKGRVMVDGKQASNAKQLVHEGQEVVLGAKCKFLPKELKIVYEDEDLVVIDKPAGLLSVATDEELDPSVHSILKRRYNMRNVYPVHRLDRETSGLLVFAYNQKTREQLQEQLAERTMHREYRALVHGDPEKGTWKNYLRENIRLYVEICEPDEGKLAITHFETLKKKGELSLLKLKLQTGRKHQIRVQASHAGFPIVGDSKYGRPDDTSKRLYLHAVQLCFCHPVSGKEMKFSSSADWTS